MSTTAATAGGGPPPGGAPGLQVLILLGSEAAAVVLEVFVAGKAPGAAGAAELVVARVGALVLGEVGAAAEGLAAQGTLVELHARVGEDMSFQLIRPVELLTAAGVCREGAFVFLEWLMDQHVSLQFVFAVECRLTHGAFVGLLT